MARIRKKVAAGAAPTADIIPFDQATRRPLGLLKDLGLHGLERIEPVLLAALASGEPLLLIGPHGTAKSLLLTRVAAALGLCFRHYNASLLNFDDLVGFPVPGKDGGLEYLRTPAAIWGAGAVIFDEISRCRPDIQNKLFPIIHERRVQGLLLEDLRYRWAAMNPPSTDNDDNGYAGSEPLDAALADRFAFIVEMPSWQQLSGEEQLAVIRAEDGSVDADAADRLKSALLQAQAALPSVRASLSEGVAAYVQALLALLAQAGIVLSARRAGMLFRSVLAVQAASLQVDLGLTPSDGAFLAVRSSLPQRAQGIVVAEAKLLAAHREAWRLANIRPGDPLRAILLAADPVERLGLAVAAPSLPKGEYSTVIADAVAQMKPGTRDAAIVHLFESDAVGRLNAAVAEEVAGIYRMIATPPQFSESLHAGSARFKTWMQIKDLLSRLKADDPTDNLRANALAAAFLRNELADPTDAEAAFAAYQATADRLRTVLP